MADLLILEWMEEFDSLTESEIHTYAIEQEQNQEIMIALYDTITEFYKYKTTLIDGICRQLLDFYRSGEKQLKNFSMQYIPVLVFMYLVNKSYTSVQTLLLSMYNLEVIDSRGQPRTISFRIPSLAQSSIYHDSSSLEPAFMAENSLRRYEECNSKLVNWGPLPQVECLNAQNRQRVITALVFLYNEQLAGVVTQGVEHTCRGISNLVTRGFSTGNSGSSVNSDYSFNGHINRIPVSSNFLMELLHVVYHGAERGLNGATHALDDIINRAYYETYTDVILVGRAIKNLVKKSPSTVSITTRSTHQSISKTMITNASFRTKKLPDDIPILDEPPSDALLDSITEEHEETDKAKVKGSSVSALKHLPKLPGLSKRHKLKNAGDQQVEMNNVSGDQVSESLSSDSGHPIHVSAV